MEEKIFQDFDDDEKDQGLKIEDSEEQIPINESTEAEEEIPIESQEPETPVEMITNPEEEKRAEEIVISGAFYPTFYHRKYAVEYFSNENKLDKLAPHKKIKSKEGKLLLKEKTVIGWWENPDFRKWIQAFGKMLFDHIEGDLMAKANQKMHDGNFQFWSALAQMKLKYKPSEQIEIVDLRKLSDSEVEDKYKKAIGLLRRTKRK